MSAAISSAKIRYPAGSTRAFRNRTGGATVAGGIYVIDIPQADGDSGSIAAGLENILGVTTARMAVRPRVVIATEAVDDNGVVQCVEAFGVPVITQCRVESTTDIAKGDLLKLVDVQTYLVKATVAYTVNEAGSSTRDTYYARALEARTSNDAGLISVLFYSEPQ